MDSLVNSSIEHLVIEQTGNRTERIGGDTEPMVRLTISDAEMDGSIAASP